MAKQLRCQRFGIILVCLGLILTTSCITPHREKEMRRDIFELQTRLLEVERQTDSKTQQAQSSGDSAKRQLASTTSEIERLMQQIQRVNGEIDALKVGVRTGRMPTDPNEEESVASRISELEQRIETMLEQQAEMISTVENIASGTPSQQPNRGRNRDPITTLSGLEQAFERNQFLYVQQDGEAVIARLRNAQERERGRFLYAESLYKLGNLREAALRFNEFIEAEPSQRHLPHALLRMGDCFRHLGDSATAKIYYEDIISRFPRSDAASTAENRLEGLAG